MGVPRVAVEAASSFGWSRWADVTIGIDRFGASAPASQLFEHFGITSAAVVKAANLLLEKSDER